MPVAMAQRMPEDLPVTKRNFLFYGHPSHNGRPYNVYLYNMVPQKLDGLFHGKSDNKMGDGWGYPYFRKPPYKSYQ
jgi:hypothetical protein